MQPNDPLPQPSEELPPLVLRPADFQLPPLVLRPPEYIPRILPIRPRPPHPGFWFSCLWCFIFLLLLNGIGVVVALVVIMEEVLMAELRKQPLSPEILGNAQKLQQSPLMMHAMGWAMAVAEVASVVFAWLVVRLVVGRGWKRQLGLVRPRLVHVILILLAAPAMMAVGDFVHTAATAGFRALGVPTFKDLGLGGIEETMKVVAEWPWWFSVLVVGVGPGIGEELWCRGFLGRGLVGRHGFVAGVILTSMFFGLLHLDPPHAVSAFAMGFLLHYVYLTTRCLWMSMLLHFLNNSAAVVLSNSSVQRAFPALEGLDGLEPNLEFISAILFLFATVVWALYVTRTRLTATAGGPPTWQPPYPGAAAPPEGSGTVDRIPRFAWLTLPPVLFALATVTAAVYLQWRV